MNRDPRGVPTGGQFAARPHTETDVTLHDVAAANAAQSEFYATYERVDAGPDFDDLDADGQLEAWEEADEDRREEITFTYGYIGVTENRSWTPGPPVRPNFMVGGDGTVDELVNDYDQWQARVARLRHDQSYGADKQVELDELNRRMRNLAGEIVGQVRTERNVTFDDPEWDPAAFHDRHPDADGPSITELVDEFDRWKFRSRTFDADAASGGTGPSVAKARLDADMRYLVHDLVRRVKQMQSR